MVALARVGNAVVINFAATTASFGRHIAIGQRIFIRQLLTVATAIRAIFGNFTMNPIFIIGTIYHYFAGAFGCIIGAITQVAAISISVTAIFDISGFASNGAIGFGACVVLAN